MTEVSSYESYIEVLNSGGFNIPPIIQIRDILFSKYGENRVSITKDFLYGNMKNTQTELNLDISSIDFYKNLCLYKPNFNTKSLDKYISFLASNYYITIHYPEILITNSLKEEHLIRDLYVRLTFYSTGELRPTDYDSFVVNRSTYELSEVFSGYKHSHISGQLNSLNEFQNFNSCCLGNGPFRDSLYTIMQSFDEFTFIKFLSFLDMFVAWESIEGGPYKRLKNVYKNKTANTETYNLNTYTNQSKLKELNNSILGMASDDLFYDVMIIEKIQTFISDCFLNNELKLVVSVNNIKEDSLKTNINQKYYKIIITDEFKLIHNFSKLIKILSPIYYSNTQKYQAVRDENSGKVKYRTEKSTNSIKIGRIKQLINSPLFVFKNKIVTLNILDDFNPEKNSFILINPNILHNIIKRLEYLINIENGKFKF